MEIKMVQCSTALSSSLLPGLMYSLNPYRGCQHACAYCYVPNVLRIPRQNWGCFVEIKKNIPVVLAKELKKKKPGVVGISTVTDPYQPIEKKYELTRYCLEQLLNHDFPVGIQTKSSLVSRDFDLLSKFSSAELMMSIGTLNDNERKILEPYASPIEERLRVLKEAADKGIKTSVFFGPVYPTITIDLLPVILHVFEKYQVKEVMIDRLNLKPGIKENINRYTQDTALFKAFTRLPQETDIWYHHIHDEFHRQAKETEIKTIDAFS